VTVAQVAQGGLKCPPIPDTLHLFLRNPLMNQLEMLSAREQLMSDIECIVESFFYDTWGDEYNDEMNDFTRVLCDAVCANFPSK